MILLSCGLDKSLKYLGQRCCFTASLESRALEEKKRKIKEHVILNSAAVLFERINDGSN